MKINFKNKQNQLLSGNLEMPVSTPKAFAIFAHCFTCSKNLSVTSTISRELASLGIAVLRFDFTGLGNSDGDFSNTNFSSNVDDLLSAYEALEREYSAPSLLIGHSLGGAAVLKVSTLLQNIKAVVTIGAPSCTGHVSHLFESNLEEIKENGEAIVNLAGREFKIKEQFINDINEATVLENLGKQKKAYMIMHSPIDETVSIKHAEKIYTALKHPKSFVTLDKADHLLTNKKDSQYIANIVNTWVARYLPLEEQASEKIRAKEDEVIVQARMGANFTQDVYTKDHHTIIDEPLSYKGDNLSLTPYQYLLAGLGGCTSMTMNMYARRKKIPVQGIKVILKHEKIHADDCGGCEDPVTKLDYISKEIILEGDLTQEQREKLLEISEKCPVNKTLKSDMRIELLK
jgi:putative redox protein